MKLFASTIIFFGFCFPLFSQSWPSFHDRVLWETITKQDFRELLQAGADVNALKSIY